MSWLEAIVLGVVQGLTEFLPVSSTAHLRVVPAFAGWEDPGAPFTAVTQLGTLAAVLLYFRGDLWTIGHAWAAGLSDRNLRATHESKMGWYILVGTVPIVVFGAALSDQIETGARNLTLMARPCALVHELGQLNRADHHRRQDQHLPATGCPHPDGNHGRAGRRGLVH
jgi:undecaprenyl-diphosphatase